MTTPPDSLEAPADPVRLLAAVERTVAEAKSDLKARQAADGHWVFDLEADATIPSEYIMLEHFLDEIDEAIEAKLAAYIRRTQADHGGWPLFHGGHFDMSASVKAYYALKLAGDDIEAPHMVRARDAILSRGGAARCNVFTRIALALFGQVPWRAVPVMPVEIMLLPRWFPFHMTKVAYWSRTVIAPLLILMALKPKARNPRGVHIPELFPIPADRVQDYLNNPTGSTWGEAFLRIDKMLRKVEPALPKGSRQRAIDAAVAFVVERLNGEDGLGGIYPAMANAVMAFDTLGYPKDHPHVLTAKGAIRKLLSLEGESGLCQPCLSPIWDTSLAAHALMEADGTEIGTQVTKSCDWMAERQILDVAGDWAVNAPNLRPGGWAFQYRNDYYPDVDDTAVVAMALHRAGDPTHKPNIDRAIEWIVGMQSKNGGWGAFDIDNTHYVLNNIPFADHGALLDPPTEDVTARCVSMLVQLGLGRDHISVRRGIEFLRKTQQSDGAWYGRWGTNYIYGTWSVLCALNAAGEDMTQPYIRRAVAWLESRQRSDGGWGEDGASYWEQRRDECKESTPSQTSWAVLGLMAAGEVESEAVQRGVQYLLDAPRNGSEWEEPWYTAVGFPRVFYLRYHGYRYYFPLWALARYRNLMKSNTRQVAHGM